MIVSIVTPPFGYTLMFFLMILRPPISTRTDTLFPYTTLFRSLGYPLLETVHVQFSKSFHSRLSEPAHYPNVRSEEHTSELQSLMRISYAVFCLKKKEKYVKPPIPLQSCYVTYDIPNYNTPPPIHNQSPSMIISPFFYHIL